MKVKVCGMRDFQNIFEIVAARPDYLGFIFYTGSKRYVGNELSRSMLEAIPERIMKTGVFVNSTYDDIIRSVRAVQLNMIQLHGDEPVSFCERLKKSNVPIIKAFRIDSEFDFETLAPYSEACQYFLFDTQTDAYGGSGQKFDWSQLDAYKGTTPFFLSGGISINDIEKIKQLNHPKLHAVDVNSQFEIVPGLKNVELVKRFIKQLNK